MWMNFGEQHTDNMRDTGKGWEPLIYWHPILTSGFIWGITKEDGHIPGAQGIANWHDWNEIWCCLNTRGPSLRDSQKPGVGTTTESPYSSNIWSFLFLSNRMMLVRFLTKWPEHMTKNSDEEFILDWDIYVHYDRRVCLHGQDTEREGAPMDIPPSDPLPLARLLL